MTKTIVRGLFLFCGLLALALGVVSDTHVNGKGAHVALAATGAPGSTDLPSADQVLARFREAAPELLDGSGVKALLDGLAAASAGESEDTADASLGADAKASAAKAVGDPPTIGCYVSDYIANITHYVNVMFPGDASYWFNYRPNGVAHEVTFYAVPLDTSVFTSIVQTYKFPEGYAGGINSPFGVPLWPNGARTSGWWVLVCKTDNGDKASWYFKVTQQGQ